MPQLESPVCAKFPPFSDNQACLGYSSQMISDFSVQNGGACLRVTSGGAGASIVMLHAGVADRRMWRDALKHFSQNYRAVSYDRRGFGETSAPDESFRHVDDLQAVLDHHGENRQILIGCSQGGRIVIDYALMRPERVAAIVLVSTAVTGAPPPATYPPAVSTILIELEKAEENHDTELVNAIEARLWLDGPLAKESRMKGLARKLFLDMNRIALNHPVFTQEESCASAMERLELIAAPTLLLWGALDFPHIQQRCEWIASKIPQAQSVVMPSCAHLPNLEQPAKFNEVVSRFVAQIA